MAIDRRTINTVKSQTIDRCHIDVPEKLVLTRNLTPNIRTISYIVVCKISLIRK